MERELFKRLATMSATGIPTVSEADYKGNASFILLTKARWPNINVTHTHTQISARAVTDL